MGVVKLQFKLMSRPLGQGGRGAAPLRDFTYSVDIKKFSRERGNLTPAHLNHQGFFKKIQERSNEKIRQSQPSSLAATFTKHISQKNVAPKRRLSSGFPKTHHHSVSLDQHLLRQRYALAREMFSSQRYEQLLPLVRSLLPHFEHSSAQRTLRYWLATSLYQVQRLEEALEEITECLGQYPGFAEGELCLAHIHLKLRNYQTAVEHFQAAGRLDARSPLPPLQLAQCYQLMQEHEKCRDLCGEMVGKFAEEGEFLMLLVESCLQLGDVEQAQKAAGNGVLGRRDSLLLYVRGRVEKERGNEGEAYILFEEALKYNNSRVGVSRALMEVVKIEIDRRDFYKAHHSISRIRFLELEETEEMAVYALLIEGVMTMMKKKSQEAIDILLRVLAHRRCPARVLALVHKYLGYGYFKVSEYAKSIKHYQKVPTSDNDPSSQYNKLLAEAVELSDKHHRFEEAIAKFSQAKLVYPQKVEPYIYIAMVHVLRSNLPKKEEPKRNSREAGREPSREKVDGKEHRDSKDHRDKEHKDSKEHRQHKDSKEHKQHKESKEHKDSKDPKQKEEVKRAEAVIEALKQLQLGNRLNPNSSNLLYHRTILHLYFEDWESAHDDINRCIEKAEENLPKYFYLRGVCYSCLKDYKKAINQYSICLSLDAAYTAAYLEKAKCYFLLGNTQKGFSALKVFMELSPNDLSIYRWIGDLLYEGMSYRDALKAYGELGEVTDLETEVMKLKCQFRVGSLSEINSQLRGLEGQGEREKLAVDASALALLGALVRGEGGKTVGGLVKRVNKQLEANSVGYLFQLIDCMNLLGVASFYLEKYSDAYQSFLLVLELYQSLSEKETVSLKSECCDEELDLRAEDIYFNLILCEIAQRNSAEAVRMINEEYVGVVSESRRRKHAERVGKSLEEERGEGVEWDFKTDRPVNNKLRKVELTVGKLRVKSKPAFNLYHDSAAHLYASSVADKLVLQLHAGYIDNMPEGPWIRRNPYGVIFTEQVMPSDHSISFEDSSRLTGSKAGSVQSLEEKPVVSRKEEVLRQLRFDEAVEAKLNSMIRKSQGEAGRQSQK